MKPTCVVLLAGLIVVGFAPPVWADDPPDFDLAWGDFGCCGISAPDGEFFGPWQVAVAPDSTVYVMDALNCRVQRFDADGNFLGKWGGLANPRGIAVDAAGDVYVCDSGNHRVMKFSSTGDSLLAFGTSGAGPGEFSFPWGIAVNASGEIYVADNLNNRIQRFSATGAFQLQFGTSGAGTLQCPTGLVLDEEGTLYVSDTCNSRVVKFTPSGFYAGAWGSFGDAPGQFSAHYGLAVDINGCIYVADSGNNRIQKFNATGGFLTEWNTAGGDTLDRPTGVAVRPGAGVTIYVTDVDHQLARRYSYPVVGVPGDGGAGGFPLVALALSPNPSVLRTRIALSIDARSAGSVVRAEIFDPAGRSVRLLAEGPLGAGEHSFLWDGRSESGENAGSGVYFVRVMVDGRPSAAGRIVRLR